MHQIGDRNRFDISKFGHIAGPNLGPISVAFWNPKIAPRALLAHLGALKFPLDGLSSGLGDHQGLPMSL